MKYIALTIGPIYKTLKSAKSTREIWGASYFFSYVMKSIIQKLLKAGIEEKDFITPYIDKTKIEEKNGVGLFHDRIIFKTDTLDKEKTQKIVDVVLKDIEESTQFETINKKEDLYIKYEFLKNYLQLHILEFEKEFKKPLLDISPYLNSVELFYQTQLYHKNVILDYVSQKQSFKDFQKSFLYQDAFESSIEKFISLPKIALNSVDFEIEEAFKDEQKLMQSLIEDDKYKDKIKPYNKYIAIVQADGDNMGAILEKIGEDEKKLRDFSKNLFEFCIDATKKVKDFGGQMIYAGGDDLLFFAPIVSKNKETIFSLCNILSIIFNDKIKETIKDLKLEKTPSLSFGVSITYYKFPLYEARENAASLLFDVAKQEPKNQIAYKVIKHSGQTFEGVISKTKLFDEFLKLIAFDATDENFLHSIYTKIDIYKKVLETINKDETKIKNFFNNYFNEYLHQVKYKNFIDELQEFIYKASISGYTIKDIHSILRLKKFLLGDKI